MAERTVKVRIAVAVDPSGDWNACGCKGMEDGEMMALACDTVGGGEARYFLTAELPIPSPSEIPARVESEVTE